MQWNKVKKTVLTAKPVLNRILAVQGSMSVFDYTAKNIPLNQVDEVKKKELLTVVHDKIFSLFGEEAASAAITELSNQYYVSTADHHGPLTHAFFFNNTWLQALVNKKNNRKFVFTFACSSISLNNSSFPRGFLAHDASLVEQRLHLFSLKHRHQPVYITPAYTKNIVSNIEKGIIVGELDYKSNYLRKILDKSFFREDVFGCKNYSEQISKGNYYLWKQLPGEKDTSLIYLNQEEIVAELLYKYHLNNKTLVHNLLFDSKFQESYKKRFSGITGAFSIEEDWGTQLFWGLKNGKRVRLFLKNGQLVNTESDFIVELTPLEIERALRGGRIMPSMALTYIILSFYHGLTCGGGFSQVNYLAELKAAWIKLLSENSEKCFEVESIRTDIFCADMALSYLGDHGRSVPATLLDVVLYGGEKIAEEFEKICKNTTLTKAVDTMIPDYFKIITGVDSKKKGKKLKPFIFVPTNFSKLFAPKKCEYCGNNPVPHNVQWVSESMLIMMSPINRGMARIGLFRSFSRALDGVFMFLWRIFERFKFVSFHSDRETWTIERANVLWDEAIKKGIEMKGAKIFGRQVDFYEANIRGKKMYFSGLPRPDKHKETEIEFWLDDKAIIKQKLAAAGVSVSPGGGYSRYSQLLKKFNELKKPVIIKPRLGSRGRHTTTHIYNENQLRKAFKVAKQLCHWVVMEEHLVGDVFRGTVVGGKLAGVLGGSPPRIIGDGKHSIRELVEFKNASKDPRVKDIKISASTQDFLARSNFDLETILPVGKVVDLTEKVGISYGGSSYEITEETHPEIKAELEKAAAAIGDPLLGFDFIIDDVTTSPAGKKWGIIECNGMPFINLHHHPLIGKPNPVARFVWELHE